MGIGIEAVHALNRATGIGGAEVDDRRAQREDENDRSDRKAGHGELAGTMCSGFAALSQGVASRTARQLNAGAKLRAPTFVLLGHLADEPSRISGPERIRKFSALILDRPLDGRAVCVRSQSREANEVVARDRRGNDVRADVGRSSIARIRIRPS